MTTTRMIDVMCPSANLDTGTLVLGEGNPGRRLNYAHGDESRAVADVDLATVRLAGPCITSDCFFWNEGCELGQSVAHAAVRLRLTNLPRCSIRPHCRWYAENGRASCGGCSLVRYA